MKRWVGVDLHKRSFTVCWMSEVCGEVKEELQDYEVNDDEYRTFRKSLRKSGEATLEAYWVKRIFLRKDKRQG